MGVAVATGVGLADGTGVAVAEADGDGEGETVAETAGVGVVDALGSTLGANGIDGVADGTLSGVGIGPGVKNCEGVGDGSREPDVVTRETLRFAAVLCLAVGMLSMGTPLQPLPTANSSPTIIDRRLKFRTTTPQPKHQTTLSLYTQEVPWL